MALDTNSEAEYLDALADRVYLNLQALDCVRHIIERNVEKGLLPNFSHGLVDFEHLYNTVGFIGIFETMKKFGYTRQDEFGNTYYTKDAYRFGQQIFARMRLIMDKFIQDNNCNYQINTEQIPEFNLWTCLLWNNSSILSISSSHLDASSAISLSHLSTALIVKSVIIINVP